MQFLSFESMGLLAKSCQELQTVIDSPGQVIDNAASGKFVDNDNRDAILHNKHSKQTRKERLAY